MEKGLEGSQLFKRQSSNQWEGLKEMRAEKGREDPKSPKGTAARWILCGREVTKG